MVGKAPWGAMQPNSQHQLWSRWRFVVHSTKPVPYREVVENAMRWLRQGFGSVGQARITERVLTWEIECIVEGVPSHDPGYVAHVRRKFRGFVVAGWGVAAVDSVSVKVLAGDVQDGRPRSQLVAMPSIK